MPESYCSVCDSVIDKNKKCRSCDTPLCDRHLLSIGLCNGCWETRRKEAMDEAKAAAPFFFSKDDRLMIMDSDGREKNLRVKSIVLENDKDHQGETEVVVRYTTAKREPF